VAGAVEGLVAGGDQAGEEVGLRGVGDETVEGAAVAVEVTAVGQLQGLVTAGIELASSSSGRHTHSKNSSSSHIWILHITMRMNRIMLQGAHLVLGAAWVAGEAVMAAEAEAPGTSCGLMMWKTTRSKFLQPYCYSVATVCSPTWGTV
jgi:hypothetical protein